MTKFLRQLRPESIDGATPAELRPPRTSRRTSDIPREFLLQDLKEKREFRRFARKLGAFLAFLMIYMRVLLIDRNVTRRKCSNIYAGVGSWESTTRTTKQSTSLTHDGELRWLHRIGAARSAVKRVVGALASTVGHQVCRHLRHDRVLGLAHQLVLCQCLFERGS